jgi:hypothetical protein
MNMTDKQLAAMLRQLAGWLHEEVGYVKSKFTEEDDVHFRGLERIYAELVYSIRELEDTGT